MNALEHNIYASEIVYELPQGAARKLNSRDGTFLFAAYDCAVIERQTDVGMYVYTVTNYINGKSFILSRRKKQLTVNDYAGIAAQISASSISGVSIHSIDMKPDETVMRECIAKAVNDIFTEILPRNGYAVRENQIKLTEHILRVIERRGVTLAESEVGTGKTHAYLVAAILAKRGRLNDCWLRGHYKDQSWAASAHMPVVISTSSIALQKAIEKDYIPELSRILLKCGIIQNPLTAVVRKGKEHYICEERLQRYCETATPAVKKLLAPYCGTTAPFDLTEAHQLSPHVKRNICVREQCSENCPQREKCRYLKHLKAANDQTVDFQITNHNYFLADRLHRNGGKKPLLPNYQFVIIDEAHKFLDAARSMYGLELTDAELPELAQAIHTFTVDKSNGGINVHKLAKKLSEQSKKLFKRLDDNIPESDVDDEADRLPAVMDSEVIRHLKSISGIAAELGDAVADSRIPAIYKEHRSKAIRKLVRMGERISELRQQKRLIYWLENRQEGATDSRALCAIPTDLEERLYYDLWGCGVPIVLTSGTLSTSGDFSRAKDTLGLCHMSPLKLFSTTMPSPFDYKSNALLYISENTPFPDTKNKDYITAVADEIERLIDASHGHAAVLFTSYNAMGQVHAILKDRSLPFPLFKLERGGINAIQQFKKSRNGVLLASGALWEGIDIPGDTLSMLIIVKLPFAVPDPIGDFERSLCDSMEEYKARAVVPDMLVKLKQGFGRLVRKETDTGVVAILDCRANERGAYRSRVLAALPPCRVTSRIETVKNFVRAKKAPDYFEL